jgi:nicotinamide-nucleotide amidase
MNHSILSLAQQVGDALLARQQFLVTAESCTGGAIAAAITDVTGSSQWFERGFVTYSNQAKQDMLYVQADTLASQGAVSESTVAEMVAGALAHSDSQVAVAVSGVAGPGGGSVEKPVGTVCLAWQVAGGALVVCTEHFDGDRAAVRSQAVARALQGVLDVLGVS